jgi:hypothetical protein
LYFRQRRQASSAAFLCKNIGLLAALSAKDYEQQVQLALKVGTPNEPSGIEQDLDAAFVADRIGDTSVTHSPLLTFLRVLFSMTRNNQCNAQTHCNLILALGRI